MDLAAFAAWAVMNGPWEGCSLDGGEVQEKAVELGIIVKTKYDPEKHGAGADADPGDDWYVFSPAFKKVQRTKR